MKLFQPKRLRWTIRLLWRGNDGSDEETIEPKKRRQHIPSGIAEPYVAPGIIKTEPADNANELKISKFNVRGAVKKQEEDDDEKKYIPRSQLKAENRALKEESAKRKRKYEETLEALHQRKAQYIKLLHDTKREQDRATKHQKWIHGHIESIYGKPDTRKMLQDESNRLEDGLDPVHASLDRLKESEEEWTKVRQIIESGSKDTLREELRIQFAQIEETMGGNMEALEKSLSSETVARNMDVAVELKDSHTSLVKIAKPRFEREQPGH
ncbi:hypothetical protein PG995_009086 [Apiospora arundinis]